MNFRTKSLIAVAVVLGIMIVVAITINNIHTGGLTGRTVECECESDADCNDGDACTEDSCLYPENCAASRCLHKNIC